MGGNETPCGPVRESLMAEDIATISRQFDISGEFIYAAPFGAGHIHDSFVATYFCEGEETKYLHQRINRHVFHNPEALMENINRVTTHIRDKLLCQGIADVDRRVLKTVPARDGTSLVSDSEGSLWRAYSFVQNSCCHQTVACAEQAYAAAGAFGSFQQLLVDLPEPRLSETIAGFHDTPARWVSLAKTLEKAEPSRKAQAWAEMAFALENKPIVNLLMAPYKAGKIPERITHNDTKCNNVLFDVDTDKALCVVDLDTVMPGLSLYDFGDMVRTMGTSAAEDEKDLSLVAIRCDLFEAIVQGYLESAGSMLTGLEKDLLVAAAKVIIFEQGIRFLADHLAGDVYYKTHYTGQNLVRCRTQFKLLQSILERENELQAIAGAKRTTG